MNGDGIPDLVVGAPQASGGAGTYKGALYWVQLTRAGTVLAASQLGGGSDLQFAQGAGAGAGAGVALLPDLDRDGMPDLLTGNALAPPPPSHTKWTRRVPHPVLIGHAASLTPY